mmetsp:Transcript_35034/g.82601  ORF Transcript_35034/g.82601 Transcript_35034/m.82601 type:complete len:216 (+) Transcript_35034:1003-1650(+)
MNFDALPASRNGDYCGVLLLRTGDPLARSDTSAVELRALLDESLPAISALLSTDDVETVAKKAPSSLPAFRTVRPRLHHRECALLLGDAVHTVKPYFGLGANSAFEDVIVLGQALDAAAVPTRHIPTRGLFFSRNEAGQARIHHLRSSNHLRWHLEQNCTFPFHAQHNRDVAERRIHIFAGGAAQAPRPCGSDGNSRLCAQRPGRTLARSHQGAA